MRLVSSPGYDEHAMDARRKHSLLVAPRHTRARDEELPIGVVLKMCLTTLLLKLDEHLPHCMLID